MVDSQDMYLTTIVRNCMKEKKHKRETQAQTLEHRSNPVRFEERLSRILHFLLGFSPPFLLLPGKTTQ